MKIDLYKILPHASLPSGGAEAVGNKAWNLMRMCSAGLTVPAAFVLPTEWCKRIQTGACNADLAEALSSGIASLEAATGLGFGSERRPLLVSVRSGAGASMPGMMETVLNIGINAKTVDGLIGSTGNPRLAWDCYRRLIQGYAELVQHLPRGPFDELMIKALSSAGIESENELDSATLRRLTHDLLDRFHDVAGVSFPENPSEQLERATVAVLNSWSAPKAIAYREANRINHDGGTAATVQRMVFGNAGGASGSGVAFTRDPSTGAPELYLDFKFNAQGEDIVAGRQVARDEEKLRSTLPLLWQRLTETAHALEGLFHDAQDFEFTIQSGVLFLLQSRNAKCTPLAALRIAVDQVDEGLISPAEALSRLENIDLNSAVRTRLADTAAKPLVRAQVASTGAAGGEIALDSETAVRMANERKQVILVRADTETSDITGMMSAAGILTGGGSRTSHGAVVARQLGKVCLVACPQLKIDLRQRSCCIGGKAMCEGDSLWLDGNSGGVYAGQLEVIIERPERELTRISSWKSNVPIA